MIAYPPGYSKSLAEMQKEVAAKNNLAKHNATCLKKRKARKAKSKSN